jgi:hypothetical protein
MTDEKKADWSEWGRFTLTALGGPVATFKPCTGRV